MIDTSTHEVVEVIFDDTVIDLTDSLPVPTMTVATTVAVGPAATFSHPVRPVLDPKVRARRIALKRAAGRRRLRKLLWVSGITFVVLAVWFAFRSPLLDVDHVKVIGVRSALPETVAKLANVKTGTNMIDVDVHDVARRIAAVPYVKYVEVSRDWPGTLTIKVTERSPRVAVGIGKEFAVLDDEDVYFRTSSVRPANLVLVTGVEGLSKPGDSLAGSAKDVVKFAHDIPVAVADLMGVDSIHRASNGDVTINLLSGQIVIVGDPTQARAKLLAVAAVLQTKKGKIAHTIDVQVPELPVVSA